MSLDQCASCGGRNDYKATSKDGYQILEAETTCVDCGFLDYWAHGHFESTSYIKEKINTKNN